MGFIEKYTQDIKNTSLFKRKFELGLAEKSLFVLIIIGALYTYISSYHCTTIEIQQFVSESYFLHYRTSAGFFPPLIFIFLFIISLAISFIFIILLFFLNLDNSKKIFNCWVGTQFLVNQLFIIWVSYNSLQNLSYPVWGFFDAIIWWNIFVTIFVPFFTILILIKIYNN